MNDVPKTDSPQTNEEQGSSNGAFADDVLLLSRSLLGLEIMLSELDSALRSKAGLHIGAGKLCWTCSEPEPENLSHLN